MVFEYLRQAWDAYRRNYLNFIGGLLLMALPLVPVFLLGIGFILAPFAAQLYPLEGFPVLNGAQTAAFLLAGALLMAGGWVYAVVMGAGYVGMCAGALKGRTSVRTMLIIARDRWKPAVGAGLLSMLISLVALVPIFLGMLVMYSGAGNLLTGLGVATGFVASFVIGVLLAFVFPALVVDRLGAVGSVKRSIRVGMDNFLNALVLMVVFSALGGLLAYYGPLTVLVFLVLAPLEQTAFTALYVDERPRRRKKV